MNPEFIMILKVNNYMNSIDKKLGKPINNYYYTAKYSMRGYYQYALKNEGFWKRTYFNF